MIAILLREFDVTRCVYTSKYNHNFIFINVSVLKKDHYQKLYSKKRSVTTYPLDLSLPSFSEIYLDTEFFVSKTLH